jgi:hypothetical protein
MKVVVELVAEVAVAEPVVEEEEVKVEVPVEVENK